MNITVPLGIKNWKFYFYDANNNRILYASGANGTTNKIYTGPHFLSFKLGLANDAIGTQYFIYNRTNIINSAQNYIPAEYSGRFDRLINNSEQMQIHFDYIKTGANNFSEAKDGIINLTF